jgi:hypothetical protein
MALVVYKVQDVKNVLHVVLFVCRPHNKYLLFLTDYVRTSVIPTDILVGLLLSPSKKILG